MSSEASVKSFCLNVSTRPSISKRKVRNLGLKKWETFLSDFNENKPLSFSSLQSIASIKKQNFCKKKIFFDKAHKCLKQKSISEKNAMKTDVLCLKNGPFCSSNQQKEKKTNLNIQDSFKTFTVNWDSEPEFEQHAFSENTFKSLKRKLTIDKSTIDSDFLNLKGLSQPHCSFSTVKLSQKEKRTLQNANGSLCSNKEARKPHCFKYDDVFPLDFYPKQHSMRETVSSLAKTKPRNNFVIPEEFSCSNNVQVLSKSALTEGFESFKKEKHAAKINVQEDIRILCKTDLMSGKCPSIGVGSEWLHSIDHILESHSQAKKKIQNLIVGGYCEQILKFQRWELSEKAICEHRNGLKAGSVLLRINSIFHDCEIIVVECSLLDPKEVTEGDSSLTYIALFQRSSFNKQQMKTGKAFLLSLPWHLLQLKCIKFPVFIGKYFKSVLLEEYQQKLRTDEKLRDNEKKSKSSELNCENNVEQKEDKFLVWKKRLNISARIQRIWNHSIFAQKISKMLNNQCFSRLTMLLQARNGEFYLLSTSSLCTDWFEFILNISEGNCYFFEGLSISHRLEQNRYPKLFQYLKDLLKVNKVTEAKQEFIYQLGVDGMMKKPSKITEANLHPFISVHFQSLMSVINKLDGRVSCRAKVLLQYHSILYISDWSISHSGNVQYVKVFLPDCATSFSKSEVCITEALVFEGDLYLDEYSQISCLSCEDIFIQEDEFPLRSDVNVADIVCVKGNIKSIDENNAFICLQCSFCWSENLVKNSKEVIFCEDCYQVVENPILKAKMNTTVASEALKNILLNIELSSVTIKRILSLKESAFEPQCNVSDVLGKEIGPLLCYVKDTSSPTILYLNEIENYY